MKTARVVEYGGPEMLEVVDTADPDVPEGLVMVAVVASSVNPVDVKMRSPEFPQEIGAFPATLGWDVSGIVTSAPEGSSWRPGDRVIALYPPNGSTGAWSQRVAIVPGLLVRAPAELDLVSSAALPLAGLTAVQALSRLSIREGDRVLVTGAAGAVGGLAVQLAASSGAYVGALVSREAHVDEALSLGADFATCHVADLSDYDAVFDTAGVLDQPKILRHGGSLVTVSDDVISAPVLERAGWADHNYVRQDPEGLERLVQQIDAERLRVRISHRYPLGDIRGAHRRFEDGGNLGKIVITL
jgi:NADPH2:quinone reductase